MDDTPAFPDMQRLQLVKRAGLTDAQCETLYVEARGMTLRDYFAAKAMDGFNKMIVDYGWDDDILLEHATQAYRIADAMLEARRK